MKYKCPCCSFYTFSKRPGGTYEICPVCFWEDDLIQLEDLDYSGGANKVSLLQARKNFASFGVSDISMVKKVRPPLDDEKYGID